MVRLERIQIRETKGPSDFLITYRMRGDTANMETRAFFAHPGSIRQVFQYKGKNACRSEITFRITVCKEFQETYWKQTGN